MFDLTPLPDIAIYGAFAMAAVVVWLAGKELPELAARLGERTGIGQAFAGMLLLGGITALPELATTGSAAVAGAGELALNNVFGSVTFNLLLLALADAILGRRALTATVARSATLLQGAFSMVLLGTAAMVITVGEVPLAGVGVGSLLLFLLAAGAMRVAARHETRPTWAVVDPPSDSAAVTAPEMDESVGRLLRRLALLGALIFIAGIVLSQTGEAIAERSGLGAGLVGLLLLALATSLPELTVIAVAVRRGHYELAIGDIFGANLFNIGMILVIDALLAGEAALGAAGAFEAAAALLGLLLTGAYLIGLLERRDRTVLRMGYDSILVIALYACGIAVLWQLGGAPPIR